MSWPVIDKRRTHSMCVSCRQQINLSYSGYVGFTYNITTPEDKELLISKGVAITPEMEALSQGKNVETVECVEWSAYFPNIVASDVAFVKGASCVTL